MTNSSVTQYDGIDFSPLEAMSGDEVVTHSRVRDITLPSGKVLALITLDNGRDHNRPEHPRSGDADRTRGDPRGAQGPRRRGRDPRRRHHRQAVHPRRRRRSLRRQPPAVEGDREAHRPARTPGDRHAVRARRAELRLRERPRARRRTRDRAQLDLSHRGCLGRRDRAARGVPRHHPRLGRRLPAAESHRHRERARGRDLEPAEAEPDAEAPAGVRSTGSWTRSSPPRATWRARCGGRTACSAAPSRCTARTSRARSSASPSGRSPSRWRATCWRAASAPSPARPTSRSSCSRRPRAARRPRGSPARTMRSPISWSATSSRHPCMPSISCRSAPSVPSVHPTRRSPARSRRSGIIGAGLMASQFALLFLRRLQVPVLITDLDQSRVDKGLAYIHEEIDKLEAKGRLDGDGANKLRGLLHGTTDKSRVRGLRLRHRGRVRGGRRQAAGVRRDRADSSPRTRSSRPTPRRCRSRRSARSSPTPSGSSASTSSTRSRSCRSSRS